MNKKTKPKKKSAPKKTTTKKKSAKKKAAKPTGVTKKKAAPKNKAKKSSPLKGKQALFAKEYLIDLNATQAAIRAGYSEKTAKEIGYENLTKPHIAAAIFAGIEKRNEKVETSAEWVLDRLHTQAIADLNDLYTEEGSIKPMSDWPLVWRQGLVVGIETHQEYAFENGKKVPDGVIVKVKISERIKRDELIGKHHAMFTDNVNLGGHLELKSKSNDELKNRAKELTDKANGVK